MSRSQLLTYSRLKERIASALAWWKRELAGLVPRPIVGALECPPRLLSLEVQPTGFRSRVTYHSLSGGVTRAFDEREFDGVAAVEVLRALRKTHGQLLAARILLPESQCLVLARTVPAPALEHVDEIMALELERKAPFQRDAIFAAPIVESAGIRRDDYRVRFVVVKRTRLAPIVEALRAASIPLVGTYFVCDDRSLPVALLGSHRSGPEPVADRMKRLSSWLGVAVVALLSMWLALYHWRQAEVLVKLEAEVSDLKRAALAARQLQSQREQSVERVARIYARKSQQPTTIAIWEEITRTLPDTAWVSEFRLEDGALTLDGYSRSAADLIGILSRWSLAARVEFMSPVVRDPQSGMERFRIRVQLKDRGQEGSETQRALWDAGK